MLIVEKKKNGDTVVKSVFILLDLFEFVRFIFDKTATLVQSSRRTPVCLLVVILTVEMIFSYWIWYSLAPQSVVYKNTKLTFQVFER